MDAVHLLPTAPHVPLSSLVAAVPPMSYSGPQVTQKQITAAKLTCVIATDFAWH